MTGKSIPTDFRLASQTNVEIDMQSPENLEFVNDFMKFREDIRNGSHGKTAQFWLTLYLGLMRMHKTVGLRLMSWKYFLPFYFALNKQNYARHGAFYVKVLERIATVYPGLKEIIEEKGLSVQRQEYYSLCTATNQRGEQTLNRDAKIAGGIKCFSNDPKSVLKWTLNRSEEAKNKAELLKLVALNETSIISKGLRPSKILNSEKKVRFLEVLNLEYINPFDQNLDSELHNLSSGVALPPEVSDNILSTVTSGHNQYELTHHRLMQLHPNGVILISVKILGGGSNMETPPVLKRVT